MAKKKGDKQAATQGDLATSIKVGTRVRHTEDNVEGRIVWANATSVKIDWDDGEQVTWKRAELGAKGVQVVEDDAATEEPARGAGAQDTQAAGQPSDVIASAEEASAYLDSATGPVDVVGMLAAPILNLEAAAAEPPAEVAAETAPRRKYGRSAKGAGQEACQGHRGRAEGGQAQRPGRRREGHG